MNANVRLIAIETLRFAAEAVKRSQRFSLEQDGKMLGAFVPLHDLRRLEALDAAATRRAEAERRGELWEPWEDDLMLDESLDEEQIARQTERTPKSVHERRRWIRRIAEAKGMR